MFEETTHNGEAEERRLSLLRELDLAGERPCPDMDRLTALAADVCGANISAFTVHDAQSAFQISVSFCEREVIPRGLCISANVISLGKGVVIADAASSDPWAKALHVTGAPFVRSYAGALVRAGDEGPIGVLSIGHTDPGKFGPAEAGRLERVAELASDWLAQRLVRLRAARAATVTGTERSRQMQLGLALNAMQDGVMVFDARGRVVEANPSASAILGISRDEILERIHSGPQPRLLTPDGALFPPEAYPVRRTLKSGELVRNEQMCLVRMSGEMRWVTVTSSPVRNAETGDVEAAVVTFTDVTEQRFTGKKLANRNESLSQALKAAKAASQAKSDFLGVISHELRTPMNAVLGCAQLLEQSRLDPPQRRMLGVLTDAGRTMVALLNDLLDLVSLEADKVRVAPEPVRVAELVANAVSVWRAEADAKGLALSVDTGEDLGAPRNLDPARLRQIIGNLLANAVKFTESGSIAVTARMIVSPHEREQLVIEVVDTGPGVPQEAIDRIFAPFEQVDVSMKRRHGGLGIGLHVVRRLALALGGDVQVASQPGEGARFTVWVDAPTSPGFGGEEPGARPEAGAAPKDVLCVDDNARNLYILGEILRAAGHRVVECASGEEALKALTERKFQIVLLDMVMPGMDGLDVLAKLRSDGGLNADTPVVACTANVLPDQVRIYAGAGTAAVIAKPIDVAAVLQVVAAVAA